jgi:phosphoglycerol transferase MdoB-like AlkP superfamily enzyme
MDIYPTVLDLCNIKTNYYAFGHSYFSKEPREAVAFLEGSYYYTWKNLMLVYSNGEAVNLFDITKKTANPTDLLKVKTKELKIMEKRLKALIQVYSHDLIYNKMVVK